MKKLFLQGATFNIPKKLDKVIVNVALEKTTDQAKDKTIFLIPP